MLRNGNSTSPLLNHLFYKHREEFLALGEDSTPIDQKRKRKLDNFVFKGFATCFYPGKKNTKPPLFKWILFILVLNTETHKERRKTSKKFYPPKVVKEIINRIE